MLLFLITIYLFHLPIFFSLTLTEFSQCPQYTDLSQGNGTQFYGKKWYLYKTSDDSEREWDCAVFQFTGKKTIEQMITFGKSPPSTATLTNFYLLNATDTYAVTLECINMIVFHINKIHVYTSKPHPENITSFENDVADTLKSNDILITLKETRHDCEYVSRRKKKN
nr:uncharacterized protein LOC111426709 [Onthophagus taurus]